METQGTYQAGNTADDNATPEKVVPLRTWTKKDNAYADRLIGVVSPSAYYLLDYLIRQIVGFHRESVRYSMNQLADVTQLSRRTIFTAVHELEAMHIIATDANDRGRTQVRTYRLLSQDCWQLPERDAQTSANFAQVEKPKKTSARNAQVEQVTSANNALDDAQTCAKFAPLIKKEEYKEKREKEIQTDANASGHGVDTPASDTPPASSPEKKSSKPRKERELSPDHQYRVDLMAAIAKVRGTPSPNRGAEWKAAGQFFRWNGDEPAPIEDVTTCFALEIQRPKWDTDTPLLNVLLRTYRAYVKSPANFQEGIKRARAAADGKYDAPRTNGRTTSTSLPSTIRQLSN